MIYPIIIFIIIIKLYGPVIESRNQVSFFTTDYYTDGASVGIKLLIYYHEVGYRK